jgi:hypothetical protein
MTMFQTLQILRAQKKRRVLEAAGHFAALRAVPHDLQDELVLPASGYLYVSLTGAVVAPVLLFTVGSRDIYAGPVAENQQVPIGYFEKGVTFVSEYTNNGTNLFVQGVQGERYLIASRGAA